MIIWFIHLRFLSALISWSYLQILKNTERTSLKGEEKPLLLLQPEKLLQSDCPIVRLTEERGWKKNKLKKCSGTHPIAQKSHEQSFPEVGTFCRDFYFQLQKPVRCRWHWKEHPGFHNEHCCWEGITGKPALTTFRAYTILIELHQKQIDSAH